MKTASNYSDTSFFQLLLLWIRHHISEKALANRPAHLAGHVTTAVAASGNPSGV
jgi:hypothetical protein